MAGAPARTVSAATRVVALLGRPVDHSRSPQLHNAAFAAMGVDAVYVAFDVAPAAVGSAVEAVRALGLLGANITVPHKRDVFDAVERRTAAAEACGAANTLFWDDRHLVADNTDVEGLHGVLTGDVRLEAGEGVVLFGAGGAARAAAVALGQVGASVSVVARRHAAAQEVAAVAAAAGADGADVVALDAADAIVSAARVVVNATPLGLAGEALPTPLMVLSGGQTALDLVYGPSETPFLASARRNGAQALDGRGMLLRQAAAAFTRWTGHAAPLDVMNRALHESL